MKIMRYVQLPKLFAHASIKVKILTLVLSTVLVPFCLSIFLIRANYNAVAGFSDDVAVYAAINRLKTNNESTIILLQNFLRSAAMEDLASYNNTINSFILDLMWIDEKERDLEGRFLINAIRNSFESFYEESHTAIRVCLTENTSPYSAFYRAERISRYMDGYISMLMDRQLVSGTSVYRERLENAGITRSTTIMVLLIVLFVCVVVSVIMANYLSTPLRKVAAAAERMAAGDLSVTPVKPGPQDEVGRLAVSFNAMNAHIAELVAGLQEKARIEKKLHAQELRNERNKKLLKESEFLALQARIQPHFLFNTLNSISRDIMFRQGKDAGTLVESLSSLLRYSLEQGNGLSTLDSELEIVRQYATIQKYRFKDRIHVIIEEKVDGIQNIILPAFTLQPLVENAFVHGLEPKVSGGRVLIEIEKCSRGICIQVQDDGVGMSEEQVKNLMVHKEHVLQNNPESIGLHNVRERLRLFTNDRHCFSINSAPGNGTSIKIVLKEKAV